MRFERHFRIDGERAIGRGQRFRHADPGRRVGDLALQVRQIDLVVINDADRADARRRQVQQQRRA